MAGYVTDFFGYRADDVSAAAFQQAASRICPFLNKPCTKIDRRTGRPLGACGVSQISGRRVICCPSRLYADDYAILKLVAREAFPGVRNLYAGRTAVLRARQEGGAIAVFGHEWGGELHLPQIDGSGAYFVDWILVLLNTRGLIDSFTAIEVQTIDTTGNYHESVAALNESRRMVKSTVGLNWENVHKRIIPQLIFKGQVLQREESCRNGLYFVSPKPVFDRILHRLGGRSRLPFIPAQPASIHFLAYDYQPGADCDGIPTPLAVVDRLDSSVYKMQEAFSSITLPEMNVYRQAIERSLYQEG